MGDRFLAAGEATRLACAFALMLAAPAAPAAPPGCQEGTQADLTACTGRQAAATETEMERLVKEINAKVDAAGKARLADSQRAWRLYRDKECVFRTGGGITQQGSIVPMLVNECERDVTQERIFSLRKQVACPGGNLAC